MPASCCACWKDTLAQCWIKKNFAPSLSPKNHHISVLFPFKVKLLRTRQVSLFTHRIITGKIMKVRCLHDTHRSVARPQTYTPYSRSFRQRDDRLMPSMSAAKVRLSPASSRACRICCFSISASGTSGVDASGAGAAGTDAHGAAACGQTGVAEVASSCRAATAEEEPGSLTDR